MGEPLSIVDVVTERLAQGAARVPVFHPVALRLQQTLARPDFTIEEVQQLIMADPALASQVLRAANSPFYGGLSKVGTIRDAIVRLGAREVANLAMVTTQQDFYRSGEPRFNALMQSLWKHAYCCAVASRWLAQKTGLAAQAQETFLAGLLHDVGKLYLLKVIEEVCREEAYRQAAKRAVIEEILTTLHAGQGHRLMLQWHMPELYCEVVAEHDAEEWDRGNLVLAVVRLANLACRKLGVGIVADEGIVLLATPEAQALGVGEVALAELEIVIEDALKGPAAR